MRLVTENYVDDNTVTADPSLDSNTPVSNLSNNSKARIARTNASGEIDYKQDILGDFLPEQRVSAVILGRHNMPIGTKVQIYLYDSISQVDQVHDSTELTISEDDEYTFVYWLTRIASIGSFKITITLISPYTEIDIGRLIIGEYIEPTFGVDNGHILSLIEQTKQYRTAGGSLRSDISLPYKKFSFSIGTMSEEDRSIMQASLRRVGKRDDIYLSLFPEGNSTKEKDYSGIVKVTKIPTFIEITNNFYSSKYEMEEV